MHRKSKIAVSAMKKFPSITKELIDEFVKSLMSAEAIQSMSMAFKKALIERALGGELGHHLGYPAGAEWPGRSCRHHTHVIQQESHFEISY